MWYSILPFCSDIRLIGQVIQTGENKQIILNCSVTGVYNTNDITEFQFNDDDSSLCRKTRQLSESEGRTDKPYTQLLNDGTTCQLIIPKATKADFVGYQCQVKLQFPTGRYCYILSETIIPYEEVQTTTLSGEELTPGEVFITTTDMLLNDSSSIIITIKAEIIDAIVIIVAIVAVVAIVLIVAVVVVKAMKYFCKYRQHVPRLPDRLLDNEERREGT